MDIVYCEVRLKTWEITTVLRSRQYESRSHASSYLGMQTQPEIDPGCAYGNAKAGREKRQWGMLPMPMGGSPYSSDQMEWIEDYSNPSSGMGTSFRTASGWLDTSKTNGFTWAIQRGRRLGSSKGQSPCGDQYCSERDEGEEMINFSVSG